MALLGSNINGTFSGMTPFHGEVRDHECDAGGVVYYANCSRYMHDARNQFIAECGVDLSGLSAQNVDLGVAEQNVRYLKPLRKGDRFIVTTSVSSIGDSKLTVSQQIVESHRVCIGLYRAALDSLQ